MENGLNSRRRAFARDVDFSFIVSGSDRTFTLRVSLNTLPTLATLVRDIKTDRAIQCINKVSLVEVSAVIIPVFYFFQIQKYKHFADDEEKLGQCDKFSMMVKVVL